MKLSTLSKILFCAASLCLAMPLAASAAGHQGCCSRHGGVSQQCSNGYVVCNDGTRSASCLCEGGSVQSRRPKGDGEGYEPRRNPAPQREAARSAKREKPYDPGHHPSQANRPAPRELFRQLHRAFLQGFSQKSMRCPKNLRLSRLKRLAKQEQRRQSSRFQHLRQARRLSL